jgi:hypothetical protein
MAAKVEKDDNRPTNLQIHFTPKSGERKSFFSPTRSFFSK